MFYVGVVLVLGWYWSHHLEQMSFASLGLQSFQEVELPLTIGSKNSYYARLAWSYYTSAHLHKIRIKENTEYIQQHSNNIENF